MEKINLFEKTEHLKSLFKNFFQHRKKVAALENFAVTGVVTYQNELNLIKACMKNRFLSQKGADFVEELLEEYHLNYLDWAYRTRWLKAKIQEKRDQERKEKQTVFDFERMAPKQKLPVHLFKHHRPRHGSRV